MKQYSKPLCGCYSDLSERNYFLHFVFTYMCRLQIYDFLLYVVGYKQKNKTECSQTTPCFYVSLFIYFQNLNFDKSLQFRRCYPILFFKYKREMRKVFKA